MSTEIQIGFPCPHLVVEEPVSIDPDRVSLITRAPISNSNSVRILVNDSVYVPPSGLGSQAVLFSGVGPFRIRPCFGLNGPDANTLSVQNSGGSAKVNLPSGDFVKAEKIAEFLRASPVGEFCIISTKGNCLSLSDPNSSGKESFVTVSGGAVQHLGFTQKSARGRTIYPSWNLVAREEVYPSVSGNVVLVPARYPQFSSPIPGSPNFKVTYGSMPERCPRCQSSYVENDYRFDFSGDVVTIANENLLYQTCLKMILTNKGSNPFHPGYGSNIMNRIGSKVTLATAASIREDVMSALGKVQNLQSGQYRFQQVTNKERLYRILNVEVLPSEDPTVFFISVVVTNGSGQPVSISITYSAPGAVALAGSNGLSLGQQPSRVIVGER